MRARFTFATANLVLCLAAVCLSGALLAKSNAQGLETFDNFAVPQGSYVDGSFVGENGVGWNYFHVTGAGPDNQIEGQGMILRRSGENSRIVSAPIGGGIGSLSVQLRKAFTSAGDRQVELLVNGESKGFSETFGAASGADPTIINFAVENINIPGNVVIELRNTQGGTQNRQLTIDNISWTGFNDGGPSIAATGLPLPFASFAGQASQSQSVNIMGQNLEADVQATAPPGFELSTDNINYASTVTLVRSGTTLSGSLFLRVSAAALAGEIAGNVSLASTNAPTLNIAVTAAVRPALLSLPYGPDTFEETAFPWYSFTVAGSQNWTRASFVGNFFMQFNGFGSSVPSDAWLILGPFSVPGDALGVVASFNIAKGFDGPDDELRVVVSTDYSGLGNPTASTWQDVSFNKPAGDNVFVPTGDIQLPAGLAAQSGVYVAFHVQSPGTASSENSRWRFDDFELRVSGQPPAPSINVSPTTISNLSATLGSPGAAQSFNVSGSGLTGNLTVTAPANFEVSTTSAAAGFGPTATVTASGALAATNVWVWIASSAAQGSIGPVNVTVTGGGASPRNVSVSGTVSGADSPTLQPPNNTALSGFTTVRGTPSTNQSFSLSGSNLAAPVTLTPPPGWQISATNTNNFTASAVTIATNPAGVVSNTAIYVRLAGTNATATNYANSILPLAVPGSLTNNILLSGNVTDAAPVISRTPTSLSGFSTPRGQASTNQSFTLSGSNLTAPVAITPPAGWQISATNTNNFTASPVTIATNPAGVVSNTAIHVRLAGTNAAATNYTNVVLPLVSAAASNNVLLSGAVTNPPPTLTADPASLTNFFAAAGVPSAVTNYSLRGSSLTTNVTVFAPLGFQVALTNTNSAFTNTLSITNNGSISNSIWVRVSANAPTNTNLIGNITNTAGALATNVALRATVVPAPTLLAVPTSLSNFSTITGIASTNQSFDLTASNLLGPVTMTVTNGYEISFAINSGFSANLTVALTNASDIASNYTTETWTNGANSGTGFAPWVLSGGSGGTEGFNGAYIGAATNTLSNYAPLYTGGVAFSIYAGGSDSAFQDTDRALSRPLAVGEILTHSFGISFDNGNKGFDLYNGTNQVFNFNVSGSGYSWTGGNTSPMTPFAGVREFGVVVNFAFTRTTNGFSYAISSPQDTNLTRSGILTNGGIDRLKYYISGAGGGDPGNIFFNNFQVAYPGSNITNLPVYVRLATNAPVAEASNSLTSRVTIASTSATNTFVNLSGNVIDRPSVAVSTNSITNLITTNGYFSAPADFTVTGRNLSNNVTLTVTPTNANNFQVSTNGLDWTNFLSFAPATNRAVSNSVQVRITATAPVTNALEGNLALATDGALSGANISLLGVVLPDTNIPVVTSSTYALSGLGSVEGSPGASTDFAVSGTFLRGPITVAATNSFIAVSTNNLDFGSAVSVLGDDNNQVLSNTVYVRITEFAPVSASTNVFLGNLVLDTTRNSNNLPAATNVAVSGTVTNWSIANPYGIRVTNPVAVIATSATNFVFGGQAGARLADGLSWQNLETGATSNFNYQSNWSVSIPLAVGANTLVFSGGYLDDIGTTTEALDAPGDAAYAGGWRNGQNGGFGFAPWQLYDEPGLSALYRTTIWDSANMNVSSFYGFVLESMVGGVTQAYRPFAAPLQVPGGSFTVVFDSNDVQPGGAVGVQLVDSNRIPLVTLAAENFDGAGPSYRISDAQMSYAPPGWSYRADGLRLHFNLGENRAYTLLATTTNSVLTNTGELASASPVAGVVFYSESAGSAPDHNLYLGLMQQDVTIFQQQTASAIAPEVVRTGAPAAAYDIWAQGFGLDPAGNGAPGQDPDADGFSNEMEFAFGTNPVMADATLVEAHAASGQVFVSFVARKSGVFYEVLAKADLAADLPGWAGAGVTPAIDSDQSGVIDAANYERRTFAVPASGKNFYRVRATIQN